MHACITHITATCHHARLIASPGSEAIHPYVLHATVAMSSQYHGGSRKKGTDRQFANTGLSCGLVPGALVLVCVMPNGSVKEPPPFIRQ